MLVTVIVALFASITVSLIVKFPFVGNVVVKLVPVPLEGEPPGADQVLVYGGVPPVIVAVQVTGLPAVAEPHTSVFTNGGITAPG